MILDDIYRVYWMLRSHGEQKRAWRDAAQARIARDRAEAQAAARLQDMLNANPSGALGKASVNDSQALKKGSLL